VILRITACLKRAGHQEALRAWPVLRLIMLFFNPNEINTQFFNFWDKLGPPHNTYKVEIARFCNQASRDPGICRV
jgi:hypothetical protein